MTQNTTQKEEAFVCKLIDYGTGGLRLNLPARLVRQLPQRPVAAKIRMLNERQLLVELIY